MKNQTETIRKIVGLLAIPDERSGFWLPNIQRPFVWSETQICRLFDSILREYPISTLLVWKTNSAIRSRKFIDNWKSSLKLTDFYVPENTKTKNLVLDGQQRLQSLYIGLRGSYNGRELYLDVLSGDLAAPDDIKFRFAFREASDGTFPWAKFKDLVMTQKNDRALAKEITSGRSLTDMQLAKVDDNINQISKTFKMDEAIVYQELDSIDTPYLYTDDDVVEVFIRANSGGTKLGKSDLLFSLLNAAWDVADESMEDLLTAINKQGYLFTRDFVLKTCLSVLGHGARYEVDKFRKEGVREQIQEKWDDIAAATKDVVDFVKGKTFLQCDKALPTYLVLLPLIYLRYRFPAAWKEAKDRDTYILRCSLSGAFGGSSDTLLDALTGEIEELKGFDLNEIFGVMQSQGRSLSITEQRLWEEGYGSKTIHLLFNIWYKQFDYTPAYENNLPQIDHIFPQSLLKSIKTVNPDTNRKEMRYPAAVRDQLANCMLLSKEENGFGSKCDTPPEVWFADKPTEYLEMHLIPEDPQLWKAEHFEKFIEARKALIREKFAPILVSAKAAAL